MPTENRAERKKKIEEILQNACALPEHISEESELKTLSLDSLSFVSAIVAMEQTFGIAFEGDELMLSDWVTVGDLLRAVEEKADAAK